MNKYLIALAIVPLFGCSSKVVSYVNSKSNFKSFATYRMVNPKVDKSQLADDSNLVFQTIKSAISEEMSKRSYKPSAVSPDLTLRYELASTTRVQTNAVRDPFNPFSQFTSNTIHEAVLLLELYDIKKKLIWQGSYDLRQERREKRMTKVINNAVAKIFTSYPYKANDHRPDPSLMEFKKKK